MVCADDREGKYPFDIQHRTVIRYSADSPRDFLTLQTGITKRIEALLSRTDALRAIEDTEQVAPVQGLTQPELAVLASVAGSVVLPGEGVSAYSARNDVERAGFTAVGFSIGVKRLSGKSLVAVRQVVDRQGNDDPYQEIVITTEGWDWIERNEDKFMLRRPPRGSVGKSDEPDF